MTFLQSLVEALGSSDDHKLRELKNLIAASFIVDLNLVRSRVTASKNSACLESNFDPITLVEEYRLGNWHFYSLVKQEDHIVIVECALADSKLQIFNTAFVHEDTILIATSESPSDIETYANATKDDLRSVVYLVGNMLTDEAFVTNP
jgi:hypothetical protein